MKRLIVAAITAVALTGCGGVALQSTQVSPGERVQTAPEFLETLAVQPENTRWDYDRKRFDHWSDLDGNGCNTRSDILKRDAIERTENARGCIVNVVILDPYTKKYVTGRKSIDIDHVVPLEEAWDSGAWAWGDHEREVFANDPLNLLAVDSSQNRGKGSRDAAEWIPPQASAWCDYAARIVTVKSKYRLSIDSQEHNALRTLFRGCPDEPLTVPQG